MEGIRNRYQRRMHAATRLVTVRRLSAPCWLLLLVGLAAMMAQSLAVHAHSHPAAGSILSVGVTADDSASASDRGDEHRPAPVHPLNGDPDCPICKQSYSGGQFVVPSAALFALPGFINFRIASVAERAPPVGIVSHSWQTRAPPTA